MVAYDRTPDQTTMRRLQRSAASNTRWAKVTDRTAEMGPAHEGRDRGIARKVGIVPDDTTPEQFTALLRDPHFARQMESARKAHFADLARRSVASRRRARQAIDAAEAAERELADLGDDAA